VRTSLDRHATCIFARSWPRQPGRRLGYDPHDQAGANPRAAADLGAATGGQQEASGARKGFFGVAASWSAARRGATGTGQWVQGLASRRGRTRGTMVICVRGAVSA